VPLYVLVDQGSFSAAEALPFILQSLGRATIVGEQTRGGGRNNQFIPVGHGFTASITFTRVTDPRTGRGWEGIGIRPEIAVPGAEAKDAAHRHALQRLGCGG
jgi:C-terminal processing protease CtpA/Prc